MQYDLTKPFTKKFCRRDLKKDGLVNGLQAHEMIQLLQEQINTREWRFPYLVYPQTI